MSLELIVGPPNSGRAGAILRRFEAALADPAAPDPLLVVPTRDDVERFERELSERPRAALGGRVTTFPGLIGEAVAAAGSGGGAVLGVVGRIWLARCAARDASLRVLARSASASGFAPALAGLIADLRSAGLDADGFDQLSAAGGERSRYETELCELIAHYERIERELGVGDEHARIAAATAGLRAEPGRWGARPVLLYGFDDLAREQVELLAALAAGAEVVFVVAFEDRAALAARAELLGVLRDELGGRVVEELEPDPAYGGGETLFEVERGLFEAGAAPVDWDGSIHLLEGAGQRGEAELVARRIASLLVAGIEPDEIAVVTRSPDSSGPMLGRVLSSFGIPAAVEARAPLFATATGGTLLRLLAVAAGDASAEEVVAALRGRSVPGQDSVDWLERRVKRERMTRWEQAAEAWGEGRSGLLDPADLRDAASDPHALAERIGALAADIAERPHLRAGPQPSGSEALELRAAAEVAAAVGEAATLGSRSPDLAEMAELLGHVRVPLWHGSTRGRVRVLSPYRIRAGRVRELFVTGLGDGSFPATGTADPLLGEARRRELGISAHRDPALEERYLFWSCVSRAQASLTLAYPVSDEAGKALARSPFVDELRSLLLPAPSPEREDDPLEARMRERVGPEGAVPAPERAASGADLARALAALPPALARERAAGLAAPMPVLEAALETADRGRRLAQASANPGPLRNPDVLAVLGERRAFGASSLEQYDLCSYRWFADRELDPQSIEPEPDALESGSIMHDALERLYREPPGDGPRPQPEDVQRWITRAEKELEAAAVARGWQPADGRARIALSRIAAGVERWLRRDAATGGSLQPRPELLEVDFGEQEDAAAPPLDLGELLLHGRIDRIDASADGKALIHDYKLSREVPARKKLIEEGRLQLPLYMAAARGLGFEPIGALYHPLGATRTDTPRGVLAATHRGALLPEGTGIVVRTDFCSDEELDELIEQAAERAREIATGIREGRIGRNPRGGSCPSWCGYAPICRMERSLPEPDEDDEAMAA